MTGKIKSPLVQQQDALGTFFESLLRDVEAFTESEAVNPVVAPTSLPTQVTEVKPVALETAPQPSIFETLPLEAPLQTEVVCEPEPESTSCDLMVDPPAVAVVSDSDLGEVDTVATPDPDWLGQELQAMLFKVAGLTLAVPLVDLNGVVEWDEERVVAMPGHADFYLGLMTHLKRQIPVVDTARLVLPENKRIQLAGEDPRQRVTRVVLIHDSRYGLACDEVNEVITLKADSVRWRSQRTQRRWLAGTVIEHMCALVDATAFAELLASRAPVKAFRE